VIMTPDKTGSKIDPDNAVERPDFYSKISNHGSGFASVSSVQQRRAPYGKGEGGGSRLSQAAAEDGGILKQRSSGGKGNSGFKGQHRGRSASKGEKFPARRGKTPEMRSEDLARDKPDMVDIYRKEIQSLGANLVNLEKQATKMAHDMDDLSTSDKNFRQKFKGGAFKHKVVNSKIVVELPLSPVYPDDHYEFFNFSREPAGIRCPESLFVRYCVYADLFRFAKNGNLTTYGGAYRIKFDKDWVQKSKQLASSFTNSRAVNGAGSKTQSN